MISPPRLLAVSDRGAADRAERSERAEEWPGWCAAIAAAGVPALLVRDKQLSDLERFRLALAARAALAPPGRLLVSARADLAYAAGADGVHLPADGPPLAAIRRIPRPAGAVRPLALFGRSTHSLDEVARARDEGASYVLFGPVFATPSKPGPRPPLGVSSLAEASRLGVPVLAIGGVDSPERLRQALAAGAHGAAGIRGFRDARSAAKLVAALSAAASATAAATATAGD